MKKEIFKCLNFKDGPHNFTMLCGLTNAALPSSAMKLN